MPRAQKIFMVAGIVAVAIMDLLIDRVHLAGPGVDGALRAAFWFGIVGVGGDLAAYEIFKRVKRHRS